MATGPADATVRSWGDRTVQTAQPRDLAALLFVITLFLVLFVVSLVLGAPTR